MCLKHQVTTSVLAVSLQQSIQCLYRNISSPCRRLHPTGLVFFHTIYSSPQSHIFPFVGTQHPAVHLLKAHWPPAVLAVCMTASVDINSSGAKTHSPTRSETRDQFPNGKTTSGLVMCSSKHSCHRQGWEAGEGSCVVAAWVASTGWVEQLHRELYKPLHILHHPFLLKLRNKLMH